MGLEPGVAIGEDGLGDEDGGVVLPGEAGEDDDALAAGDEAEECCDAGGLEGDGRHGAGCLEDLGQQAAKGAPVVARADDQGLAFEVGRGQGGAVGEAMARWHDGDEAMPADQPRVDLGRVEGADDEADIDGPAHHRVALALGAHVGELEADAWMARPVGLDHLGHDSVRGDRHVGDGEPAVRAGGEAAAGRGRAVDPLEDRPRLVEEVAAGLGERHGARGPAEQRHGEPRLELGDEAAHRGLGDAQPFGGAPEAQLLGDGDEDREVAQLVEQLICFRHQSDTKSVFPPRRMLV